MKSMKNIQDVRERPSAIVCIAYHQLSLMCGIKNPVSPRPAIDDALAENARKELSEELPLIGSFLAPLGAILAPFRNGFIEFKETSNFFTTLFSSAENLLFKGVELVEPLKEKVATAIESPLESVDSAICVSRDYLEEKVPGVKVMPATQIVENIQSYFRDYIIEPMKNFITALKDFGLNQKESNSAKDVNGKKLKGTD